MSRRRDLRRRAERAHRCYDCGENDGRLRLYRNRAYCLSCYFVESSNEPIPVTLGSLIGEAYTTDGYSELIAAGAFDSQRGKTVPLTYGGLGGPVIGTATIT